MGDQKGRLSNLDLLRTFAAIAVCAYHLNWGDGSFFDWLFSFGYLGVDVFFCISGFITPLSFVWGKYEYKKIGSFLLSRFVRLYPAFALIALIEMGLYYFGSSLFGYGSNPDRITWMRTLANFTFSADFIADQNWYVPVFWTLAIEAQCYLALLLCFPLLNSKKIWLAVSVPIVWSLLPFTIDKGPTLLSYSALFAMGMAAFLVYTKRIPHWLFLALLALAYVGESTISSWAGYTAVGTALAIIYLPPLTNKWIEGFSKLSYSFFLIHITFGGAVMFHFKSFPMHWHYQLPAVILGTLVSTLAAYIFHRWYEAPIHRLSRKLKKK